MMNVLIGALLIASTAVAQTPKTSPAQSTTGSAKKTSAAATQSAKSTQATSGSATRPAKPIPDPSLKEKLESGDKAIPSYRQQKDAGIHRTKNRYSPRRTESGARKDTMKKQSL